MPKTELGANSYDAQIVVTQTNASSKVTILSGYWSPTASSEMIIETILVITYPDGSRQQQLIKARGVAHNSTIFCEGVAPAVGNAGSSAIRALVERITLTVKLLLAQNVPS